MLAEKKIPRISFIFLGWPNLPPKFGKKMKPKRNYRVPPYPAGRPGTKILPSVRGCGGGPPLSGAGVPVIRERSKSAFLASGTPDLDLSREGSPNPPQRQASILPGHSTLPPGPHHAFTLELPVHH
jgi:hypothetical protein